MDTQTTSINLQNLTLPTTHLCALCGGEIDKDWNSGPVLGSRCRNCHGDKRNPFDASSIQLVLKKKLMYEPWLDRLGWDLNWKGSMVKVNGQVGVVNYKSASGLLFPGGDPKEDGTSVSDDLRRALEAIAASRGDLKFPDVNFPKYTPQRAKLRELPLANAEVCTRTEQGCVKEAYASGLNSVPTLQMLHCLVNMHVRRQFSLQHNLCCEGGIQGYKPISPAYLDIRNGSIDGTFASIGVSDFEDLPKTPEVKKYVSRIMRMWARTMRTLLRVNWEEYPMTTPEEIWQAYCKAQDAFMAVLGSRAKVIEFMEFARQQGRRFFGCGCPY